MKKSFFNPNVLIRSGYVVVSHEKEKGHKIKGKGGKGKGGKCIEILSQFPVFISV